MRGTIDKLAEWASDGGTQIVAPTEAKIARGWNVGEQPPAQWENYRVNRDNEKQNELIDLHDLHCENDYNDTIADRCAGLPNADALLNPVNAINRYTDIAFKAVCRGYDYANGRECLFAVGPEDDRIYIVSNADDTTIAVDYVDNTNISTSYNFVDLCCDGNYIFALYQIPGLGVTRSARIYKIPIGAAYAKGVATTATGYTVASHGTTTKYLGTDGLGGKRICIANDDCIAFIDDTENQIVVVEKDFTGFDAGIGNLYSIDGDIFENPTIDLNGICSDGTRVWFTAKCDQVSSSVDWTVLCAVAIANPADPMADMARDWETNPVVWLRKAVASNSGVTALVFDGAAVNVLGNLNDAVGGEHKSFIVQFDVASEFAYLPRFIEPSGHTAGGWSNGGGCWTGRRIAHVFPSCPIEDITTANLWEKCNKYQSALALVDPYKGGANVLYGGAWGAQSISISDARCTVIKSQIVPAKASRIADVVFADDCIWILVYYFDESTTPVDLAYLIRVPSISSRG